MQNLRTNPKSYSYFVNNFVSCALLHGYNTLKTNVPSIALTCSDETIILWYLENSMDTWHDMMMTGNHKYYNVMPKYTLSGDKGGSRPFGGWKPAGRIRFNELFGMVEQDRLLRDESFDEYYKEKYHAKAGVVLKKKKTKTPTDYSKDVPSLSNHLFAVLQPKKNVANVATGSNNSHSMPPLNTANYATHSYSSQASTGGANSYTASTGYLPPTVDYNLSGTGAENTEIGESTNV